MDTSLIARISTPTKREGARIAPRAFPVWFWEKILLVAGYNSIYALLMYGYFDYIATKWRYYGFVWQPNDLKIFEALVLTVFLALLLPASLRRPSDLFLHLHFLLPVLPMLVLFGAMDLPRGFLYSTIGAYAILVAIVRHHRLPDLRMPRLPPRAVMWALLWMGYAIIISILLQGGWRYFNLSFAEVYEYRRAVIANLPGIYGYLNSWTSKVILPMALLFALNTGSSFGAALAALGSVLMFGLTSHKSTLMYPFALTALYLWARVRPRLPILIGGYMIIVAGAIWEAHTAFLRQWVASLLLRRLIFVPALLNYFYYDFFSSRPFVYWAYSKITLGLIPYPYESSLPFLVGQYYFSWSPLVGANTGWLGSGYANAGLLGLLLYAVALAYLLLFYDALRAHHRLPMLVAGLAPVVDVMLSSDFTTALFNHGLWLHFTILMLTSSRHPYMRRRNQA